MKRMKLALMTSAAVVCTAAFATAQTPAPAHTTPSAYEYGNYDYYSNQDTAAAPAAPADKPAAPATSSGCGCESSCGCQSCNSCGCNDCCKHHCLPLIKPEECCPLKCEDQEICRAFDCCCLKEKDTTLTGWVSGGIMGNSDDPASHFNGPVTFADRDDGQFNQAWGVLERTAPKDNCGCFIGGRVDFMFGSDFFFTTAAGLDGRSQGNVPRWNTDPNQYYGFAMPQLYLETDFDDLKIKWGHFFTIIGYEVVPDIGNFFYTHAYTMQYAEPFTHTGILASKPLNENWSWSAGIVESWNSFDANTRAQFLGGVTYTQEDWGSLAFSIVTGDESEANLAGIGPFDNRTMYSVVWSRPFTSRWTYVLQHDLGVQQDANGSGTNAEWYGINQYVFYKINCCWSAGVRIEWFRDDDGYVVTGLRPNNPLAGNFFAGNFYELSVGLNWKPNANFMLRPELRYDWFNGSPVAGNTQAAPYDDGAKNNQFLFGLDAIYQF